MDRQDRPTGYAIAVERPATLIALGLNVILGVALAIALILKVYMLVLTDLVCADNGTSLGNLIRCTALLDMAAAFLAASAVVAFAAALLVPRSEVWSRALGLAAAAAFVSLMNLFLSGDYDWRLTLASVALFAMISVAMYAGRILSSLSGRKRADSPSRTSDLDH